jgi:hypothetical protein
MANIDQKLVVTELDFATIKANLKNFLRDQSEFSDFDFEAAGINVLLDILAYNTHYNAFYSNMIANEMFLDTALLRDSIVSHAKQIGYTPISAVASRATINLQVYRTGGSTQTSLNLPKFTRFQSESVDSVSYTFVNTEDLVGPYDPTCGRFCFGDIYIYQGQPLSFTFTYDATNNTNQKFELPDAGIDTSTLEVLIQESASSARITKFTLSSDATTAETNANVFYLEETRNGKYAIYFGDDVIGKSLVNGNVVIVTYVKTDGPAANKANSFTSVSAIGGFENSLIFPIKAAVGGNYQEDTERVRFSASKFYTSTGRGVTTDDIISVINKNYPYFDAINVWGGEQNDPPVYGKVFIAAKPSGGYEITESEKLSVINNVIKPICVVTVTPEFVDVDFNYINVNSNVYYDPTKTNLSLDAIKTLARNAIIAYKNIDLDDFNSRFRLSKMLRKIDDSSAAISYSEADCTIQKRLLPALNASRNYTVNFGVPLAREDSKYKIFSTPGYTQYDEEGALRTCFLEETPGSSSGIESISVISATGSYESTPSITILGDGVGANAYPIIVNGKVTSIVVDKPGVNYKAAKAYLYYQGELDATATFNVSVQNRYGLIRSYYFDTNNIKTVLDPKAGEIDYQLGKITLSQLAPTDVLDSTKTLKITAKPETNNFESSRNRIITIDEEDSAAININVISI